MILTLLTIKLLLLNFFHILVRPPVQRTVIRFRSFKNFDLQAFKNDILSSPLYSNPAVTATALADQLSSTLTEILDIHAPNKTKSVVQRPPKPWINSEVLEAKRVRHSLERRWRQAYCPMDR